MTAIWIAIFLLELAAPLIAENYPGAASLIYGFLHPLCHQRAERSFALCGHKMGLCARCTGFFLGLALFGTVHLIFPTRKSLSFTVMILLILPMAVDGTAQLLGFWNTSNIPRLFTGIAAAFGIVFWIYPYILSERDNSDI